MLDDLAALGPFFAVATHPAGAAPPPPWRPVAELATAPGSLLRRITATRAALAARGGRPVREIDPKIAASAVHLSLMARLVAPALALAVLGRGADMHLAGLWWQDEAASAVPLSIPSPAPLSERASPEAGHPWAQRLLRDAVIPLTDATAGAVIVSGRVLRGNAASGINAAAGQLARSRPDLADEAWARARALLSSPWLDTERQPAGPDFRRSSCCLFYRLVPDPRLARSATCADCVLGPARPGP